MNRNSKKFHLFFPVDFGGSSQKSIAHYKDTKCVPYVETQVIEMPNSSLHNAKGVKTDQLQMFNSTDNEQNK